MKIYIAGKITGEPNYKEKFDIAATSLEAQGHIVLNPAESAGGHAPGRLYAHLLRNDRYGRRDLPA